MHLQFLEFNPQHGRAFLAECPPEGRRRGLLCSRAFQTPKPLMPHEFLTAEIFEWPCLRGEDDDQEAKKILSDGSVSMRLVWDQRRANLRWRRPGRAALGSPTAFSFVELEEPAQGVARTTHLV